MCNRPKMPAPALPQGFNESAYLAANPDVAAAGYGGAEHWQKWGHQETWRPGVTPAPQQQSATGNFAQAGIQHFRQQKAAAPPPPPNQQGARAGEVLRGAHPGAGSGNAGRNSRRTDRTGNTMLTAGGSGGGTMLGG